MKRWALLAVVAGLVFAADQASKFWAVERLTTLFSSLDARTFPEKARAFVEKRDLLHPRRFDVEPVPVVRQYWQWRYTQNRAAAFGLLSFIPESVRVGLFHLITVGAAAFIIAFYRQLGERQRVLRFTLALLLGGALGNGLDRVLHGYVIDFIDWHWRDPYWLAPQRHWPTFNVADCGVSVGMVLLLLHSFFASGPTPNPAPDKRSA